MPTVIKAGELFFSRVEPAYSPQNRAGYQVVYHTSDLDSADVEAIEDRVQCFRSGDVDIRYQFFKTPGGKFVLTASKMLEGVNRQITDRNGRTGAFISHCYILSPEELAKIGNNPFILFDEDTDRVRIEGREDLFELTAPGMVDIQKKNAGQVTIMVATEGYEPEVIIDSLQNWDAEKFETLVNLGLKAKNYMDENYSVAIRSESPSIVREMIALLFYTLPPDNRVDCSFDTFTDNCLNRPGQVWLLGGELPIPNARMTRISLDTGTIENLIELDNDSLKASPFLTWLEKSLDGSSLRNLMKMIPEIHKVQRAFELNQQVEKGSQMQEEAFASFIRVHGQLINDRFTAVIEKELGDSALAAQVIPLMKNHLSKTDYINIAITQRINPQFLAPYVVGTLRKPSEVSWQSVENFAKKANHSELGTLASIMQCKQSTVDERTAFALSQMDAKSFDALFNTAFIIHDKDNPSIVVTERTAGLVEATLRGNPLYLQNFSEAEQIKLFRALKEYLDPNFMVVYQNSLSEKVLKKVNNEGSNQIIYFAGGGLLVLLLIIAGGAAFLLSGGDDSSESDNTAVPANLSDPDGAQPVIPDIEVSDPNGLQDSGAPDAASGTLVFPAPMDTPAPSPTVPPATPTITTPTEAPAQPQPTQTAEQTGDSSMTTPPAEDAEASEDEYRIFGLYLPPYMNNL